MTRIQSRKAVDDESRTKGAVTRQRILDATAKVLSNKGVAGTRLSDVAREAQMQAPAIYYYFDSREELIVEVIRYGSLDTREVVSARLDALPKELSAMDRILVAVEAHLRNSLEISDYANASARNVGQLPDHLKAQPLAEQVRYGQLWRQLISAAVDSGECATELDVPIAVLLVLGALNYTAEWFDPARSSIDRVVHSAQSLVYFGLGGTNVDSNHVFPSLKAHDS